MAAIGPGGQDLRQLFRVARGQPVVAGLVGQVDHGRRTQPAVQVVVQQHLGHGADLLNRRAHGLYPPTSWTTSGTWGGGCPPIAITSACSAASAGAKRAGSSARSSSMCCPCST